MSLTGPFLAPSAIRYPESDGEPMAENTRQFEIIVTIKGNLDVVFKNDPNVFIAGDLFWYPVEGDNKTRLAADVMAVFGRPKGHRGSYRQWEEGGIAPQVAIEILSPGNRAGKMVEKFEFYERYGVEEYYVYDPDDGTLEGWLRKDNRLQPITNMQGWVSPRMGIRFELVEGELVLYRRDGRRFLTYVELQELWEQEHQLWEQEHQLREEEHQRAELERLAKEQAQLRADKARQEAEQAHEQAEKDRLAKEQAEQRVEQLLSQLRALGIKSSDQVTKPPGETSS